MRLATCRVLARDEAKGSSVSTSALEAAGVTHAGYHGARDDRPELGDRGQPLTLTIALVPSNDLSFELIHLLARAAPLLGQHDDNRADHRRDLRIVILADFCQKAGETAIPLGSDDAELGQVTANGVAELRALLVQ